MREFWFRAISNTDKVKQNIWKWRKYTVWKDMVQDFLLGNPYLIKVVILKFLSKVFVLLLHSELIIVPMIWCCRRNVDIKHSQVRVIRVIVIRYFEKLRFINGGVRDEVGVGFLFLELKLLDACYIVASMALHQVTIYEDGRLMIS